MKRIEATIQGDKIGAVSNVINDLVGGYTILEGMVEDLEPDKK